MHPCWKNKYKNNILNTSVLYIQKLFLSGNSAFCNPLYCDASISWFSAPSILPQCVTLVHIISLTCLCCRAACTVGLFSICWASRRFLVVAMCCCCMVARMLLTVGCLFFSMFVKLVGHNRRRRVERERERGGKGGYEERRFQIKSFHTAWTQLQRIL